MSPEQLPTATVEYVSGLEAAADVWVWFHSGDGDRRYGKAASTPSLSRRAHPITIDVLPGSKQGTWARLFDEIDAELDLIEGEWWAAVTWLAADKRRHCWMHIQRVHHTEPKEWTWEPYSESQQKQRRGSA